MWANRAGSNVPTLSEIHCVYIYYIIYTLYLYLVFAKRSLKMHQLFFYYFFFWLALN